MEHLSLPVSRSFPDRQRPEVERKFLFQITSIPLHGVRKAVPTWQRFDGKPWWKIVRLYNLHSGYKFYPISTALVKIFGDIFNAQKFI